MAAIILPQRWRRQPDGPVTIDTGHNLASGLAWCRSFGFGPLTRWGDSPFLAPGNPGVTISGSVSLATGQSGRAAQFAGASGDYLTYDEYVGSGTKPIGSKIQSTGEMSVFVIARRNGAGNGEEGIIGPASGARWRLTANSAGNKKLRWLILGSAVNVYATTAIVDGQDFTGGGTVTPSRVAIYFNGVNEASTGGDTINPSGQTFNLGDGQGNFNGLIYFAAFWWRALGDHEMKALHDAPYAMFRPLRRRLYFAPAAGGGAVTADASLIEAADGVQSSGSVAIAASASLLEGEDYSLSAGAVSVTAAAVLSEQADAVSALAGTAAFADASLVEGADTLASAGVVAISASSAITEGQDSTSAQAAVLIAGAAAIVEAADRLTSEGGSASFGTAEIVEAADRASASGTVAVSVSAALQEQADALTGAATVLLTASAALLEQADRLDASGSAATDTRTATATITESADTSSSAGAVTVSAAAAIIEAGDIIVGQVGAVALATAALYEDADGVSASAFHDRFADAALYEAGDRMTAAVVQKIARRLAVSDAISGWRPSASDALRWNITPSDGLN